MPDTTQTRLKHKVHRDTGNPHFSTLVFAYLAKILPSVVHPPCLGYLAESLPSVVHPSCMRARVPRVLLLHEVGVCQAQTAEQAHGGVLVLYAGTRVDGARVDGAAHSAPE